MRTIFANVIDPSIQTTLRPNMVKNPLIALNGLARESTAMASMDGIRATHGNTVTKTTHKAGSKTTMGT